MRPTCAPRRAAYVRPLSAPSRDLHGPRASRSGFLVLGACSALTHTVLGQLKAILSILGGWALFAHAYPPKAILGAALAFGSIVAYTRTTLREQAESRSEREPASGAVIGEVVGPLRAASEAQRLVAPEERSD